VSKSKEQKTRLIFACRIKDFLTTEEYKTILDDIKHFDKKLTVDLWMSEKKGYRAHRIYERKNHLYLVSQLKEGNFIKA
jgi:hypothetical protein